MLWQIAAIHWMLLHGPENQSYWINTDQITALRQPIPADLGRFAKGVSCIVTLTDGKIVTATESCNVVYQLIMSMR